MNNTKENILIAESIGMQKNDIGWFDNEEVLSQHIYDETGGNCHDILYFDKSWDWLMSVVLFISKKNNTWINIIPCELYSETCWITLEFEDKVLSNHGESIIIIYETIVEYFNYVKKEK